MKAAYFLLLPLGLVSANTIGTRGKNNGCPASAGGCGGTCVHTSSGDFCQTQSKEGTYNFPCGRVFSGNGMRPTSCGGRSGGGCTAYGDAETFCPNWA